MKSSSAVCVALAAGLILATALLLRARGEIVPRDLPCTPSPAMLQDRSGNEAVPLRLPLSCFPAQLARRVGTDVPLDENDLDVLGHPDYLRRLYQDPSGGLSDVELFIPYFASQSAGDTIHSPQNCLPGSGWAPLENTRVELSLPGHAPFPVNRYVISKAGERELVLYWFWAHDRGIASEYWAKYYLVRDSIRMKRSDGALVRLVTPMLPGETAEQAQQRLSPFTAALAPLLNNYIPR
jgi:EpsI family protein